MTLEDRLAALIKSKESIYNEYIKPINDEIALIKNQFATQKCPFEVGDKVKDRRGRVGIITGVFASDFSEWMCQARYIRKDETPGDLIMCVYKYDGWVKI